VQSEYKLTALQGKKPRLAVFDVEGVLIPKKRYLLFEVGRTLRFSKFMKVLFYGFLYEVGLASLKSAFRRIFRAFAGIKVEDLRRIFEGVPLLPGVEVVFEKLRSDGWKTALISSGLPTIVVQDLASTLKADYAVGFEMKVKEEAVTGEIWGDVLERKGKLSVLKKILSKEALTPEDCVVVADDRNNLSIFLPEALKIGYNPDFAISMKADKVVTGKLVEILPLLNGEKKTSTLPSRNEVAREVIHATGCVVPVLSGMLGLFTVSLLIFTVTLLYMMSELARMERMNLPIISSITRYAATKGELYEFATSPMFFALGIFLTLLLFPASASSAAIAIFALGDSAASIFGKTFGKRELPFNKEKTLEGSVIGFLFALLGGVLFVSPLLALIGAIVAMSVESLPLPVNDNLATPLFTGAVLTLIA
jgi:dolichol kinase